MQWAGNSLNLCCKAFLSDPNEGHLNFNGEYSFCKKTFGSDIYGVNVGGLVLPPPGAIGCTIGGIGRIGGKGRTLPIKAGGAGRGRGKGGGDVSHK